jgi:glutamyl-tRNA reductase
MSAALESLFVFGTSHHTTPLAIRERFALSPEQARELQAEIAGFSGIRECLVLNTCNRLEIYGLAEDQAAIDGVLTHLCRRQSQPEALFRNYAYTHTNLEALQHVLEVSSGLDSQMVGETEILGQIKRAYAVARDSGCTGNVLNRLFEKSFQAAKAARSQTAISRGQVSIGTVAVDLAARIFNQLSRSRVLLLGSGEVGEKTAQALKSRGVEDLAVSSRTYENAHQLAHRLGGSAIDFGDFITQIDRYDIIIGSTSAAGFILRRDDVKAAMRRRPERPSFLIDLALPRDFEPGIDSLDNVYLYNLDDLSRIANENIAAREAEIAKVREILKAHAWTLWLQLRRRTLMPRPLAESASQKRTG